MSKKQILLQMVIFEIEAVVMRSVPAAVRWCEMLGVRLVETEVGWSCVPWQDTGGLHCL